MVMVMMEWAELLKIAYFESFLLVIHITPSMSLSPMSLFFLLPMAIGKVSLTSFIVSQYIRDV